MQKINSRQICFIMFVYTVMDKVLTYPTYLANVAGRDLLWSALINFTVQGVVVWAVAYLSSKTDKTLFELIEGTLGNVAARIIFGFFAAFFLFATLNPVLEQKVYVHNIFYDTAPSLMVFLPFFFFAVYAGSKGFCNMGRCADVVMPIAVLSLIMLFVMGNSGAEYGNLLPLFSQSVKKLFKGALVTSHHFTEPLYMLMFLGHFRYRKGDAARITLSYAAGAVVVLFLLAQFYAIYGAISPSRDFAVSKLALFAPIIETIGRIDLIALYALEVAMLFAVVIKIQLAVYCLEKCTGFNNKPVFSLIVNLALMILVIVFNNGIAAVTAFYSKWAFIAVIIFAVAAPLAAFALRRRER